MENFMKIAFRSTVGRFFHSFFHTTASFSEVPFQYAIISLPFDPNSSTLVGGVVKGFPFEFVAGRKNVSLLLNKMTTTTLLENKKNKSHDDGKVIPTRGSTNSNSQCRLKLHTHTLIKTSLQKLFLLLLPLAITFYDSYTSST